MKARELRLATLLAALACASPAFAQVPAGGEFRVNIVTTGDQRKPAAAADAAGNYVVVWESPDGSQAGIFGRRFDAAGTPRGAEFRVNTATNGYQERPAIVSDARGNFVVVWDSFDGVSSGIYGQRFDAAGAPRGSQFRISTITQITQVEPAIAIDTGGNFVVAWTDYAGYLSDIAARRYDATGAPRGAEILVNSYQTSQQHASAVAMDPVGNFVIAWTSLFQDGSLDGVFGQRFSASGAPRGGEFRVNSITTDLQYYPTVVSSPAGNAMIGWALVTQGGPPSGIRVQRYDANGAPQGGEFVVSTGNAYTPDRPKAAPDVQGNPVFAWVTAFQDGGFSGIYAQRLAANGAARGIEFRVNSYTTTDQRYATVATDPSGNFLVAWTSHDAQDGSGAGVYAQRFGGLIASALAVDSAGNHVFEPGETVDFRPSWRNVNGQAQAFSGTLLGVVGPAGATYAVTDASAAYGTVANGAVQACTDCYGIAVSNPASRPVLHWDATALEALAPDAQGQRKAWFLHLGRSFSDVPSTDAFYPFVETLLHTSVTAGCTAAQYCPADSTSREQMAVFVLVSKEGAGYLPPACGTPMFNDVPASSPFCRWVEELARRGVAGGCGGGAYCPSASVLREQMAVFVLRTLDPSFDPPACGTPVFNDVPASSPFCKWIEELARRGIVAGCGGGAYCPQAPVTRAQMAVFLARTFGLGLYGP